MTTELRILAALALVLCAALEMYLTPGPTIVTMAIWFVCAMVIGLLLGRWWALLLAFVPWPLQMAAGLIGGRYLFLGYGWEVVAASTAVCGLAGIAFGVILVRSRLSWRAR